MLKLQLHDRPESMVPDLKIAAQAAARGMEVLIIGHLRQKNNGTQPNRYGLPKSNYYADAAKNVEANSSGNVATVEIEKDGIALHYEGGTVRPKKKALAIPIDPSVAGIWPSEASGIGTGGADDEPYALIWPKGSNHGFIKDTETNDLLWVLVPKATIPADPSVLPTDDSILNAAEEAVWEAVS